MIGIPVIAGIQVAVTGIVIGDYCITYKYGKKEMFYMQIILQRGLPFEVKIPSARPVDISALSEVEFNEELENGYVDMQAGRTKNARKAFSDIRKDYGL